MSGPDRSGAWLLLAGPVRVAALLLAAVLALVPAACGRKSTGASAARRPPPSSSLHFTTIARGLSDPVLVTSPPGDPRLFVVEKPGRIRIVAPGSGLLARPFLDLGGEVNSRGSEQGLLGLAFPPDYRTSGRFYVDYTDVNDDVRIVRYRVSRDPDVADPGSAEILLRIEHPYANHNGGMLAFGPDRMLYVGVGDGGREGDPRRYGQNRGVLLAKILRLDVSGVGTYTIPRGNPFSAPDRPETWAWGLRNPWRFSFDRATGDLYVADVGQDKYEEVDVATAASGGGRGLNYGWSRMEGFHCYRPPSGCDTTGLTMPVLEYDHSQGCAIIGGYVYRGRAIPALRGQYLYADYCSKWVRSFRYANGKASRPTAWATLASQPLGFGEDANGELYIGLQSGEVVRIEP